jgi:hypothetical protein
VNKLVEKANANVLLISNEREIEGKDFKKFKERLGNRTYRLRADTDGMIEKISKTIRDVTFEEVALLRDIISKAKVSNLRTVKTLFLDAIRIIKKSKVDIPESAIRFFSALRISVADGQILEKYSFYDFNEYTFMVMKDQKLNPLQLRQQKFFKKYFGTVGGYGASVSMYEYCASGVLSIKAVDSEFRLASADGPKMDKLNGTLSKRNFYFIPQEDEALKLMTRIESVVKVGEKASLKGLLGLAEKYDGLAMMLSQPQKIECLESFGKVAASMTLNEFSVDVFRDHNLTMPASSPGPARLMVIRKIRETQKIRIINEIIVAIKALNNRSLEGLLNSDPGALDGKESEIFDLLEKSFNKSRASHYHLCEAMLHSMWAQNPSRLLELKKHLRALGLKSRDKMVEWRFMNLVSDLKLFIVPASQ